MKKTSFKKNKIKLVIKDARIISYYVIFSGKV